LVVLSRSLPYW